MVPKMVQPCRGLHLEADIEDITSDSHGFHIKSLALNLWLGRSWKTYILEGKMTKCQRKRIKTNQNSGFFYTVERVDDWLYLRKQFNPIVSTGNLSYSWFNAGFMNYQRQPLCVDTAVQPAAILPSLSESIQCSFEYGQTECVRLQVMSLM